MAQFYTLEEAARVLGMSPEELKSKAQHREVRAFMDSGSWQFRVADIDELARRRGLGSDPELSLSDLDLSIPPSGTGSAEINLTEFQLGVASPDLAPATGELKAADAGSDQEILLDDLSVPPGPLGGSSSTIIGGMDTPGKLPSDSDVRLVPDLTGPSDSDVRLSPTIEHRTPSDSDVTLVSDDSSDAGLGDLPGPGDTAVRQSPMIGSSGEVAAADAHDSDFELTPSSVIDALQPDSGSDFELTALDASDEYDSTPLTPGPGDSDVTASEPAASGINLGRPSDSGISLQGLGDLEIGAESIELAPLSGDEIPAARPAPKPAPAPAPAAKKPEKDIFEDTDFEVDALGDDDADDRTMQIEAASDFDLEDSGSDVFAIDEDDVDQNAATAMAPAVLDDEDDDGFSAIAEEVSAVDGGSGWDVESEGSAGAVAPSPMLSREPSAEWSGLWVGVLGAASVLTLLLAFVSMDLVRNMYDYRGDSPASGLVRSIAGLMGG